MNDTPRIIEQEWDGRGYWRDVTDYEHRGLWAVIFEAVYLSARYNCKLLNQVRMRQTWFFPASVLRDELSIKIQLRGQKEQMGIIKVFKYWQPMSDQDIAYLELIADGMRRFDKENSFDEQFEKLLGIMDSELKKRFAA